MSEAVPYFSAPNIAVYCGDVKEQLRLLPAGSVQTCVTSPPYWGLRDYGVEGQLGMERTPEEYVANMVEVFREVRRVLRDDGVLWLNIGDSYNAYNGGAGPGSKLSKTQTENRPKLETGYGLKCKTLKPTDLVGIPWMVAFALRADGWYLRSEVIWHKRSPMPESVRNRPSKAHEQIFLLSKSRKYFYDVVASAEQSAGHGSGNKSKRWGTNHTTSRGDGAGRVERQSSIPWESGRNTRNMRSVWSMSSFPFKGAHFACFPPELVRRCLIASMSEQGCCPTCAAPRVRVVKKIRVPTRTGNQSKVNAMILDPESPYQEHSGDICGNRDPKRHCTETVTVGWKPGCNCEPGEPVPCTVLDPFHGAGTSMIVARRLGHAYVGIDLNPAYIDMSIERLAVPVVFPHERKAKGTRKKKVAAQRELFTEGK